MKNQNYTAKNETEAQNIIAELKNKGYRRISNCFWYEKWENSNGETATVERDF